MPVQNIYVHELKKLEEIRISDSVDISSKVAVCVSTFFHSDKFKEVRFRILLS